MERISPKKSLGQNFLIDKNITGKIANALDINPDDVILEIGCGTGALTEQLLARNPKFIFSVEIDQRAIESVSRTLSQTGYKNFELIHSDIRKIQISDLITQKQFNDFTIKVIGNIPYNISADILFWVFAQRDIIVKAVLTIQKEVAQRLTAKPKNKLYGITTVAMNLVGECRALFDINPKCFYPVPKVTSTVVEITPDINKYSDIPIDEILKLVKAAFNQRRKVLKNAMNNYINSYKLNLNDILKEAPEEISAMFSKRAEQLTTQDFIALYNLISEFEKQISVP